MARSTQATKALILGHSLTIRCTRNKTSDKEDEAEDKWAVEKIDGRTEWKNRKRDRSRREIEVEERNNFL